MVSCERFEVGELAVGFEGGLGILCGTEGGGGGIQEFFPREACLVEFAAVAGAASHFPEDAPPVIGGFVGWPEVHSFAKRGQGFGITDVICLPSFFHRVQPVTRKVLY